MVKNLFLLMTSLGFLIGLFSVFIEPNLKEAEESRAHLDMANIRELVLSFRKEKGTLPSTEEMESILNGLGKDIYGNPYEFEKLGTENSGVFIIRSNGKDGKIGGFGENRDQILIHSKT